MILTRGHHRGGRFWCPCWWGEPIYGKLDAEIAASMMSINAVKAVEIGAGMEVAGAQREKIMRMKCGWVIMVR